MSRFLQRKTSPKPPFPITASSIKSFLDIRTPAEGEEEGETTLQEEKRREHVRFILSRVDSRPTWNCRCFSLSASGSEDFPSRSSSWANLKERVSERVSERAR